MRRVAFLTASLLVGSTFLASTLFAETAELSVGQTIYVPAYSYVRIGERAHQFELAVNLCIRNTDTTRAITILSVDYHAANGRILKRYLDKPVELKSLASMDFYQEPSDISGGLAPSFIIKWKSVNRVSEPIAEAAMVGDRSGLGVSFMSVGKVIKDTPD
ncbi:MAG: DUF3124 domain-containing protein [Desulfomonile tiedjei]|uniref:DUF3124 domain-containing protein n=1 Tax=Desulfomonile tiedjei TaxID=2358 RepID=A0A9D6V3M7_9BACT|nr:DUF3124 domain-containing protein [Desulfomonile tiedjei]